MARRTAISSRLASALAAAAMWVIPGVSGAADGTIHFTGNIVEPSYGMQIAPAPTASAAAASVAGAEITFSTGQQSAKVSVDGVGGLPFAVQCSGQTTTLAVGCHFGQSGGKLSLATKSAPAAGVMPGAVVTVAYD